MLMFDQKYCWINTFSDNYLATSPKTSLYDESSQDIKGFWEERTRTIDSFRCAWNYLPSLLGASSRCKTKRFVWERVRLLKAKGRAWEKGKKTIKALRSPQMRCLFFPDSRLWHLSLLVFKVHLTRERVNYSSYTTFLKIIVCLDR